MAGIGVATIYAVSMLISLLVLGLHILGGSRYLTSLDKNTCDMTYMFEYPQYVKIVHNDEIEGRYPRFGLYAYGEGFVTEKHRRMKFSGIPVLFIPGNAGSHEQARSLASLSLRKSINDRVPFHFDYFTVSLGKDYSALYGGVLDDETTYVSLSISKILSLYAGTVDRVVLIGHSMGGIIAKAALIRSLNTTGRADGVASLLLTLASPHEPLFLPDRTIAQFYEELKNSSHRLRKVGTNLVSIGGGRRDILVSSFQVFEPTADLNVLTSGIPGVWRSIDHLAILWCKQFVLSIVRALFDCVDTTARPPKITSDYEVKFRSLSYHLTSRNAGKRLRPYEDRLKFERGAEWIENPRRQYTWTSASIDPSRTVFLMIRLGDFASYDRIAIETVNMNSREWVFACSAHAIEGDSRVCEWGWNLTNRTTLLPDPTHRSRKSLDIPSQYLDGWKVSHIVVRIPIDVIRSSKKNSVKIHVDLYKEGERTIHLKESPTSWFFNIFRLGRIVSPNPYAMVTSSTGSLRYHVILTDIRDTVAVEIETRDDTESSTKTEPPLAILDLHEASSNGSYTSSQMHTIEPNEKGGTVMKKCLVMHLSRKDDAVLRIGLGTEYAYRITIRRSGIVERIVCSVRDRWPIVYQMIISLCLIAIATRIDHSRRKTAITVFISILGALGLDLVFEALVGLGMLHIVAVTACCFVVFCGSIAHNVTVKFLARIVAVPSLWFDWVLGGFERLPILTTFIFLSLASATCGAVVILIFVPFYFLKLTRMYEDYLEELFMASLRQFIPIGKAREKRMRKETWTALATISPDSGDSTSGTTSRASLLNHLLLFVTVSFAAIPAIPSALVWAKSFRYETRLTTEDPVMLVSWLVLTSWGSLGLIDIPRDFENHDNRCKYCGILLRLTAWILAFIAAREDFAYYQWVIPPVVAFTISILAILLFFPGTTIPNQR